MVTRLRDKGQITIPATLREGLKLSKNSILSVVKVGNAILIVPQQSTFELTACKFSKQAKKRGITLESLLKDLKKVRQAKN
jgi:AbrB family looped-hinge helix DNA binding protein